MTNYTARFAGVATLALALLPAAALTTTAHASTYPAAVVHIADLNLASPAGQNTGPRPRRAAGRLLFWRHVWAQPRKIQPVGKVDICTPTRIT